MTELGLVMNTTKDKLEGELDKIDKSLAETIVHLKNLHI
jgi:hypothetical protein